MKSRLKNLFGSSKTASPNDYEHVTAAGEQEKSSWDVEPQYLPSQEIPDIPVEPQHIDKHATVQGARAEIKAVFESQDIVANMESRGFAKDSPRLVDQIADTNRNGSVAYYDRQPGEYGNGTEKAVSEHDALVELDGFLENAASTSKSEYVVSRAQRLRENLAYIGADEYSEATKGMADYWKSLLDADMDSQLCVVTGLAAEQPGEIKSDEYVFESILQQFNDDELARYQGRLVASVGAITAEKARVILLDDWMLTGQQMGISCRKIMNQHPELASKLEVQCLAASADTITRGVQMIDDGAERHIPVRAFYQTPAANIAGAHSSPKKNFRYEIESMLDASVSERSKLPALAAVRTPYTRPGYEPVRKNKLSSAR